MKNLHVSLITVIALALYSFSTLAGQATAIKPVHPVSLKEAHD